MLAKHGNYVGGRERICGCNRRVGMFSRKHLEDCSLRAPPRPAPDRHCSVWTPPISPWQRL